jgi:hypothetical protein
MLIEAGGPPRESDYWKGRNQRSKSKHGQAHKPNLTKYYRYDAGTIDLTQQEFRTTLLKPKGVKQRRVKIDHLITSIEWRYEQGDPVLHGNLTVRKFDKKKIRIVEGDTLKLDVRWFGRWHEVWRMVLRDPEESTAGGSTSFTLDDPMSVLQESRDTWHYAKSKKGGHPEGWKCHQIARDVAKRYKIRLGKVAKGKRWIRELEHNDYSPIQILQRAYALERAESGHRYVMRWSNGKLNILPMRRNPLLYVLGSMIQDAAITYEERGEDFCTAVTVRATLKEKGKKAKKITVLVTDKQAMRKYGFIHRELKGGNVKSEADARKLGRRHLNKKAKRKRTITGLTHHGIAFIRRGDAIRINLPEKGFKKGKDSICFVSAGSWSLSGGTFSMNLDVTFDDPFATTKKVRKDKDKKKRDEKREADKKEDND